MCIAMLGRVVSLEPEGARVQIDERICRATTLLVPDVAVNDHVLVAGGLVIARLSPEEAEIRRLMFDQLSALARETLSS